MPERDPDGGSARPTHRAILSLPRTVGVGPGRRPRPHADASETNGSMMMTTELREEIRSRAFALGFAQVGFAPAERPAHADEYLAWLERGLHGEMGWMARQDAVRRRLDPGEALEGCRTVIVVTLRYGPTPDDARRLPVIARYARGRDYHDVFEERLDALAAGIGELSPDARTKRYVDYGPVLERDHAQRAGLGWIGKNTMLIHPRLGSYLMLGELLTDLALAPDEPFVPDRCGTCRRCIETCPTDAILEDRSIDSTRCISYLTIELRGPIPRELRAAIGMRVFGCDICQEVCPWNADAPAPEAAPFAAEPGTAAPAADLVAWAEELLALDDEGFRERYRGTAFARPGRGGLLRNVVVGIGNGLAAAGRPDPDAVAVVVAALRDPAPLVRLHAAWALGRTGSADARSALRAAGSSEDDPAVREEIEMALDAGGRAG